MKNEKHFRATGSAMRGTLICALTAAALVCCILSGCGGAGSDTGSSTASDTGANTASDTVKEADTSKEDSTTTENGQESYSDGEQTVQEEPGESSSAQENSDMKMIIGETEVPVKWEDNDSVSELEEMVSAKPLVIQMSMYDDFEQVGPIGASITRSDTQMTTEPGDVVLYSGDQIVVFYGSNSWAYTMLGHIDLSGEELTGLLGSADVELTLSK